VQAQRLLLAGRIIATTLLGRARLCRSNLGEL
jgi:hypothetical protein